MSWYGDGKQRWGKVSLFNNNFNRYFRKIFSCHQQRLCQRGLRLSLHQHLRHRTNNTETAKMDLTLQQRQRWHWIGSGSLSQHLVPWVSYNWTSRERCTRLSGNRSLKLYSFPRNFYFYFPSDCVFHYNKHGKSPQSCWPMLNTCPAGHVSASRIALL